MESIDCKMEQMNADLEKVKLDISLVTPYNKD